MLQDQIQNQRGALTFSKVQNYLFRALLFLLPLAIFPFPWDWTERSMSILILVFATVITAIEFLKLIWEGKTNILKSALDVGLFLLLFAMLLSTIFSVDINTSLWGVDARLGGGLVSFLSILLVTISSRTFLETEQDLKYVIFSFAAGLLINNILSAISFFGVNIWSFIPIYKSLYLGGVPLIRSAGIHLILNFVNLFLCVSLIGEYFIKKEKVGQLVFAAISAILTIFNIVIFSLSQGLYIVLLSIALLILFSVFLTKKVSLEKGTSKEILIFCLVTALLILIPFSLLQIPTVRENILPENFNLLTEINLGSQISWIVSSSVLVSSFGRAIVGLGVDTFSIAYNLYRPMDVSLLTFNDITFYKAGAEIFTLLTNGGLVWFLIWLFFGYLIGRTFWNDLKQIKLSKDAVNNWRLVVVNMAIVLIYLSSLFVTYSTIILFTLLLLISLKAVIKNLLNKDSDDRYIIKFWTVDLGVRNSTKPYVSNLSILLSVVAVIVFGGLTTFWFSKGIASIYTLKAEAYTTEESLRYQEQDPTEEERAAIVQKLMELRSKSVDYDKNNPLFLRKLSLAYAERLVLEVEAYSELIQKTEGDPETEESDTMLSDIIFWKNNTLELSKKSITAAPYIYANRDVNTSLYMLLIELGISDNEGEVLTSIENALQLNPINYNLHFYRAQVFLVKEDMQSSLESLSNVLTINPYHIPSIVLVANINKEMGDMDMYEAYLKAAKKILEDEGLIELEIYQEIASELNDMSTKRELTGDTTKEPEAIEIPKHEEDDQIDLGLDGLEKDGTQFIE